MFVDDFRRPPTRDVNTVVHLSTASLLVQGRSTETVLGEAGVFIRLCFLRRVCVLKVCSIALYFRCVRAPLGE